VFYVLVFYMNMMNMVTSAGFCWPRYLRKRHGPGVTRYQ
jgi:hypothetical protein